MILGCCCFSIIRDFILIYLSFKYSSRFLPQKLIIVWIIIIRQYFEVSLFLQELIIKKFIHFYLNSLLYKIKVMWVLCFAARKMLLHKLTAPIDANFDGLQTRTKLNFAYKARFFHFCEYFFSVASFLVFREYLTQNILTDENV